METYKENILKEVKSCVKKLVSVEKELFNLNKEVYEKREQRSFIKDQLAQVIRLPEFAQLDKMKELFGFIVKEQSKKLISQEYNFNVVFK